VAARRGFADAFVPKASPEEQAILAAVQRPINVACIGVPGRAAPVEGRTQLGLDR